MRLRGFFWGLLFALTALVGLGAPRDAAARPTAEYNQLAAIAAIGAPEAVPAAARQRMAATEGERVLRLRAALSDRARSTHRLPPLDRLYEATGPPKPGLSQPA